LALFINEISKDVITRIIIKVINIQKY